MGNAVSGMYDCIVVGSGPAGLGAAFHLAHRQPELSVLVIDKERASTGGLRNDCKMNFTFPVGFPVEFWSREAAENALAEVYRYLQPEILSSRNLDVYRRRADRLGVQLIDVRQAHLGTDRGLALIHRLLHGLGQSDVQVSLREELLDVQAEDKCIATNKRSLEYRNLVIAPGRQGFGFLQDVMDKIGVPYVDNVVDIGLRVEVKAEQYPIVQDYYDPKFLFPDKVRTFCTNSGTAHVVKEKYVTRAGKQYFSVNGHAFSSRRKDNRLVNFALLKTVRFTEPLASGQEFAEMLGQQAMLLGGGQPIMQRVGDFRLGKRSKAASFTGDLYDFEPSLKGCTPGDISLSMPAKILRAIWRSMKLLDTIVPGVLYPATVMYYPEIKLYANRPQFIDEYFQAQQGVYLVGDGAGTSRGITAAWASGIRAAEGILHSLV